MINKPQATIEQVMYSNYIKYDTMLELTKQAVGDFEKMQLPCGKANTINVYIDMHSMLKQIYGLMYQIQTSVVIAASFINLCAHIRAYFRSRHRVETRIYLVYSENRGEKANSFFYNYNYHWIDLLDRRRDLTDLINSNLDLLETLCPYLNDIFFMRTTAEPVVAMYDRINKDEILYKDMPNFIFSKDPFVYQIPAVKTNSVIFRPSKYEGQDRSYMVSYLRVYQDLYNQKVNALNMILKTGLSPSLLSLFMAMTYVPNRDVKSCYNVTKATNNLINLVQRGVIVNGYNYATALQSVYNEIQPNLKNRSGPEYDVISRFKAIDLIYQHSIYMNTPECMDESYLIRKIDDDGVREINNRFFKEIPLDLNRL